MPKQLVERSAVVVLFDVAEFVEDDVVDAHFGRLDQCNVEGDDALRAATAPQRLQATDDQFRVGDAQPFDTGKDGVKPFVEDTFGLFVISAVEQFEVDPIVKTVIEAKDKSRSPFVNEAF